MPPAHLNPWDKPVAFCSDKGGVENAADVSQCLPSDLLKAHSVLFTLAAFLQ